MKILYGVAGDGLGHAIRSRVVIERLLRQHDVHIVASRRAHAFLAARLPNVRRIWGMEMAYGSGRVRRARSLLKALGGLCCGGVANVGRLLRLLATERFDVVVSDFETFSHVVGRLSDTPVITIDNIQALARLWPGGDFAQKEGLDYRAARAFVRLTTMGAHHHIVTSFFGTEWCDRCTTVVPPILRPEILRVEPRRGSHLLVYQTAAGNQRLVDVLGTLDVECRCYGIIRDLEVPVRQGHVIHFPFSEVGFIEDLRTAAGVVTNGGFTLISEALHLGKPVLSIPLAHQAEQALNGYHLQRLGYGLAAGDPTRDLLRQFLSRLDELSENLRQLPRRDNTLVFEHLERLFDGIRTGRSQGLEPTAGSHAPVRPAPTLGYDARGITWGLNP